MSRYVGPSEAQANADALARRDQPYSGPQGTPNPLREDGLYPVLVSPGVFEALVDRVDWGEADADGFYTPTLHTVRPDDTYKAVAPPAEDRTTL